MTVAILHSYTHVLGWAYFRIGWAYFRVKGGPIFGRGVLENTPIPLFEQILNSSPMGVFSRDYGNTQKLKWSHDGLSRWTVQSRSNFDDDGARPVPYLQLVSPVKGNTKGA